MSTSKGDAILPTDLREGYEAQMIGAEGLGTKAPKHSHCRSGAGAPPE